MKTKQTIFFLALAAIFIFASCEKEAGEGGNSSIFGKVYVKDYNLTFTVLNGEYYGMDEEVYIIYGDDLSYSERLRTSYDGTYEFKYLRPGKYTIYAYSDDSTLQSVSGKIPIIKEVEITDKNTDVEVEDIVIFK